MMPVLNIQIRGKTTKVLASNHLQNKGTCTVISRPLPSLHVAELSPQIHPEAVPSITLVLLPLSLSPFPFFLPSSTHSLLSYILFFFFLLTPFLHIFLDLSFSLFFFFPPSLTPLLSFLFCLLLAFSELLPTPSCQSG